MQTLSCDVGGMACRGCRSRWTADGSPTASTTCAPGGLQRIEAEASYEDADVVALQEKYG
jgi:hypothetical protein